jgi:hypothetical protein
MSSFIYLYYKEPFSSSLAVGIVFDPAFIYSVLVVFCLAYLVHFGCFTLSFLSFYSFEVA